MGILDITAALAFRGASGVPPVRVLQGIASGIMGQAAFSYGLASANSHTLHETQLKSKCSATN